MATLDAHDLAKELSVVLTDRLSVPNATVEELVGYGRSPYTGFLGRMSKEDRAMVAEAMECCQIAHKRKELLSNLSDGERQKVMIAKALAQVEGQLAAQLLEFVDAQLLAQAAGTVGGHKHS